MQGADSAQPRIFNGGVVINGSSNTNEVAVVPLTINGPATALAAIINVRDGGQAIVINDANAVSGYFVSFSNAGVECGFIGLGTATVAGTALADFSIGCDSGVLRLCIGSTSRIAILADGSVLISNPTGAGKGAGTINVQTGIYIAGVNIIQTGTFTMSLTGCTTVPTVTATYRIVNGAQVVVDWPSISGTSNATTMTITGFPAAIQPARTQVTFPIVTNSAVNVQGIGTLTGGTWSFQASINGAAFTASGSKGVPNSSITYNLT